MCLFLVSGLLFKEGADKKSCHYNKVKEIACAPLFSAEFEITDVDYSA